MIIIVRISLNPARMNHETQANTPLNTQTMKLISITVKIYKTMTFEFVNYST